MGPSAVVFYDAGHACRDKENLIENEKKGVCNYGEILAQAADVECARCGVPLQSALRLVERMNNHESERAKGLFVLRGWNTSRTLHASVRVRKTKRTRSVTHRSVNFSFLGSK